MSLFWRGITLVYLSLHKLCELIHDLNLTIIYWILLLEQSIMQCSMSIIVVCQIVNSGLIIISMYSSVFVMAVCRKGR